MRGAIRNFIRLKPLDPNYPHAVAKVDMEHIIGFRARSWDSKTALTTEIMLSNGQVLVSNESPKEFEERLTKLAHNVYIKE